jgi:hypothetical protein
MGVKGGKQWITKLADKFRTTSLAGRVFGQNKTYNLRSIDDITSKEAPDDWFTYAGDSKEPKKPDDKPDGIPQNPHRNDSSQVAIEPQYRVEHEPYRWNQNGDGVICISKAHIYEVHPYGVGVELHALSPLQISCASTSVVYGEFTTNEQGVITSGYTLKNVEGTDVPESVHFILPDEDGSGSNGTYRIPICWIVDGKLERYQWDAGDNSRQAKLGGTVKGHRGPLWWFQGYDKLNNVGDGKNIFRSYLQEGFDQSDLRTIKAVATGLSSPYCGTARVRVRYEGEGEEGFDKADSNSIEVLGNGIHREWYIDDKRVAVFEDGLLNGIVNLSCTTLTTAEATAVTVVSYPTSQSDYTDVVTSAGTTTVGTTSVSGLPTTENKVSVLQSNTQITVAHPTLTAQNTVSVWHTGTTDSAVKTLLATPVAGVPHTTDDYVDVVKTVTYGSVASATAGTTANVLTSQDATVQVADYNLTVGDYTTVLTSGGTTTVAGIPTSANKIGVATSNTTANAVTGVNTANVVTASSSLCVTAITLTISGVDYTVLAPCNSSMQGTADLAVASSTIAAVTSVTYSAFVNDITYEQSALGSVPEVSNVVTSTGTTNAVTSIPSKTIGTTTVVATLDSTSAVTSVTQTTVLQNVGTAVNAYTSVSETVTVYDATTVGTTPVVKSLPTTTIGVTDVVQTLPTVKVLEGAADDSDLTVVTSTSTTSVLTNYQSANVWQYSEGDKYVEPASGSSSGDELDVVQCPTTEITGCQD